MEQPWGLCPAVIYQAGSNNQLLTASSFNAALSYALYLSGESRNQNNLYRIISCDVIAEVKGGSVIRRAPKPKLPDDADGESTEGKPGNGKPEKPKNGNKQDEDERQSGETEPADDANNDAGLDDNKPSYGSDTGDSNQADLPEDHPFNNPDYWVDNEVDEDPAQTGTLATEYTGQPGATPYENDVTEEYLLTPGASGVWYDNLGNIYTYDGDQHAFVDLLGTPYDYTRENGSVYITPNSTTTPEDILPHDWNDPGDDDSWLDNYSDLPTDEDGETDFSSTFGLDDGE